MDVLTPEGRIVGGHPMNINPVTRTNEAGVVVPVFQADGVTPATETYVALAIAKGPEQDWKQTPWGQIIHAAALAGWPNGEFNAPTFAWKVTDGDSQVPNTKGKKPCEREGYPGHWVVNCSTRMPVRSYHVGNYDPMQQIQNKAEIKAGDYGRIFIQAKANNPSKSPGVYLNPTMFELTRAGALIDLGSGPSAADAFGGAVQSAPAAAAAPLISQVGTMAAAAPAITPAPSVTPAPDFLNPPPPPVVQSYNVNGQIFTKDQLIAGGWSEAQIAAQAVEV